MAVGAVLWPGRGGVVRRAIPDAALRAAHEATACDVFLSVGTSSVVYPAAGLVAEAKRRGAFTVEINLEATGTAVDIAMAMPAEKALPQIRDTRT